MWQNGWYDVVGSGSSKSSVSHGLSMDPRKTDGVSTHPKIDKHGRYVNINPKK